MHSQHSLLDNRASGNSMNLALSVRPAVCSQLKISEVASQFYLIFCMKLCSHKVRKSDEG